MTNVLRESQEQLFHEEQKFLLSLANTVKEIGGADEDVCALQVAAEQLRDPFLLVVVGEFNSGKSTMLNAMLGSKFLAEVCVFRDHIFCYVLRLMLITGRDTNDIKCEHFTIWTKCFPKECEKLSWS